MAENVRGQRNSMEEPVREVAREKEPKTEGTAVPVRSSTREEESREAPKEPYRQEGIEGRAE